MSLQQGLDPSHPQSLPGPPCPPPRVLWLQRPESVAIGLEYQLLVLFGQLGAYLEIGDLSALSGRRLATADLVLIDAFEQMEAVVETMVIPVRMESRAPLVMLTGKHSLDQMVMALQAGADAIWSLESGPSILRARCQALLRRWQRPPAE